jgi:hypothetical protein
MWYMFFGEGVASDFAEITITNDHDLSKMLGRRKHDRR